MKAHYDFSKGLKNPYSETILQKGYSITEHYSPEDVANDDIDDTKDIISALVELMTKEESTQLLLYIKNNFKLSCPPSVWYSIAK
jgi:hypothetical protein